MSFKLFYMFVHALSNSILFPEKSSLLISKSFEFNFKNGKCKVSKREKIGKNGNVRGNRSKLIHYFDHETCNISKEEIEDALRPYLKKLTGVE